MLYMAEPTNLLRMAPALRDTQLTWIGCAYGYPKNRDINTQMAHLETSEVLNLKNSKKGSAHSCGNKAVRES